MGRISTLATIAAMCVALLISGCATTGSSGPAGSQSASPHPVTAASAAAATPEQQAKLAVQALLRAFVPPPGAKRLAGAPASAQGRLGSVGSYVSGDEAQQTTWWLAPGAAQALLGWEGAHLPRPFTSSFSSSGGGPGSQGWAYTQAYARPSSGGLTHQYLIVSVTDVPGGQVAIRVDADAAWQPVRPVTEKVPARAKVVTITLLSDMAMHGKPLPPPATITNPAITVRIAALINNLKVSTAPKDAPCPEQLSELELTFRAIPGGPALAVAQGPGGCSVMEFTVAGKPQLPLFADGTTVQQILTLAGLHWKVL
jgi:hypothetical protein